MTWDFDPDDTATPRRPTRTWGIDSFGHPVLPDAYADRVRRLERLVALSPGIPASEAREILGWPDWLWAQVRKRARVTTNSWGEIRPGFL